MCRSSSTWPGNLNLPSQKPFETPTPHLSSAVRRWAPLATFSIKPAPDLGGFSSNSCFSEFLVQGLGPRASCLRRSSVRFIINLQKFWRRNWIKLEDFGFTPPTDILGILGPLYNYEDTRNETCSSIAQLPSSLNGDVSQRLSVLSRSY